MNYSHLIMKRYNYLYQQFYYFEFFCKNLLRIHLILHHILFHKSVLLYNLYNIYVMKIYCLFLDLFLINFFNNFISYNMLAITKITNSITSYYFVCFYIFKMKSTNICVWMFSKYIYYLFNAIWHHYII